MKTDPFSEMVFPGWMRVSLVGLLVSGAAAAIGGLIRQALQGNVSAIAVVTRLVAAGVYGFGIGFSLLFLLLVITGAFYGILRRR